MIIHYKSRVLHLRLFNGVIGIVVMGVFLLIVVYMNAIFISGLVAVAVLWLVFSIWRLAQDWKLFKNDYQAVVFDAKEVTVPFLSYQVFALPWGAVKAVELDTSLIVTKRIKLLLHEPKAIIAKEPHWWNRWIMHYKNLIYRTPFCWNPRDLEGSAQEQFEQLKNAHEGKYDDRSLMDHLIDDTI